MTSPADLSALARIPERPPVDGVTFAAEVLTATEPVVLRGQVADWPAVAAGTGGPDAMAGYIRQFDQGQPTEVLVGQPGIAGHFFYSEDMTGFNFKRHQAPLATLLDELVRLSDEPSPPALYAGAATAGRHLPGWVFANPLDLPLEGATPRVWIGNATRVSTHFDASPNLACVVAGRRRFLMFPPDQIGNLYVGPLENTLAGQPVSMVDPDAPDFGRYPRFAEAMRHAQVAELGPGDAIYMPSLWWHNVRASGALNVLVNYWWDRDPQAAGIAALAHGLLALRDLPPAERAVWRHWFDHYVFGDGAAAAADHLPLHARGVLGPAGPARSERLKGFLRNVFSPR